MFQIKAWGSITPLSASVLTWPLAVFVSVTHSAERSTGLVQGADWLEGRMEEGVEEVYAWGLPHTHMVSPRMSKGGHNCSSTRWHTNPSGRTVAAATSGFHVAHGFLP